MDPSIPPSRTRIDTVPRGSLHSALFDPQWPPRPDPDDKTHVKRPRGVIFDYGNTLVRLDPGVHSTRTDYADVVARPGATRLAAHLARTGILGATGTPAFVERFLEVRERNREEAERAGREIPALTSLRQALAASGITAGQDADMERALQEFFLALSTFGSYFC